MKKLGTLISLLCILNVLAILGLAGYLLGTGRLDKSKAQVITDLMRTNSSPADFRLKVYDLMNPPTTQPGTTTGPATAPALAQSDIPASALERNDFVRKQIEAERLRLENAAQDLRNRQEWLVQAQAVLEQKVKQYEADRKTFDAQIATAGKQKDDTAFQHIKGWFDQLKPKQIKELLMAMPVEESSRYLAEMEAEQVAKLVSEYKTPDEKTALNAMIERVRGGTGTGAASDKGPAALSAAAPAAKVGP